MIKQSLIVASLLFTGTSAVAQNDFFIGANLGTIKSGATLSGTATYDGNNISGSASDSDRDTNINIKAGIVNNNNRYSVQTGKLYDEGEVSYTSTTLNYDRLFTETSGFTPFVGVHIGKGKFEVYGWETTSTDYGIQAGVLKDLNKNFQFEAGLRYTKSNASFYVNEAGTDNGKAYNINATLEADDATAMYIGVNYKF